jgi:exosome complex RNA-binding protein Rrp4
MKEFLKENDIISAEVQQISNHDGKISLQTKTIKYSKLINGFMFRVDHNFIKKVKSHILEFFVEDEYSIGCIIGTNGAIWIYQEDRKQKDQEEGVVRSVSISTRNKLALIRNAILALEKR